LRQGNDLIFVSFLVIALAGSPNSYLYTFLSHFVKPPTDLIKDMTSEVLVRCLSESFLFENKVFEIHNWISALLHVSKENSVSDSIKPSHVLKWFDEALCSGMRNPYKVLDRMTKLVEECQISMSELERRKCSHINNIQRRILELSGHFTQNISSTGIILPFSPATLCCLDGIVALLKKHSRSSGLPPLTSPEASSELIYDACKCFFFSVSRTLKETQATGKFFTYLIGSAMESLDGRFDIKLIRAEHFVGDWSPIVFIQALLFQSHYYTTDMCDISVIRAIELRSDLSHVSKLNLLLENADLSVSVIESAEKGISPLANNLFCTINEILLELGSCRDFDVDSRRIQSYFHLMIRLIGMCLDRVSAASPFCQSAERSQFNCLLDLVLESPVIVDHFLSDTRLTAGMKQKYTNIIW
jgi:hypothetical protein